MDALRQVEDLLPSLTRAEKAQLLRAVVQGEFPARMHKSKKSQRIIRQVGVQAYRDSSTASIQTG